MGKVAVNQIIMEIQFIENISSYISLYIILHADVLGRRNSQSADWFNEKQVNVMVDRRVCIRELCTVDRCLIISMSV